jgi:type IV pilus assembly protein PilW
MTAMNRRELGFTLIEILISLALASVVSTAVYTIFSVQHRIYLAQRQIAAIQQSLRTCMYLLEDDIKLACFDPLNSAAPAILIADKQAFRFQADLNENGSLQSEATNGSGETTVTNDRNEQKTYGFARDANGHGRLTRASWNAGGSPMADYIETLDFVYLDKDGTVLSPLPLSEDTRKLIRSVEVTLVARSERPDQGHRDTGTYSNLQDEILIRGNGDHFHRRSLSKAILLRNTIRN